MDDRVKKVEVKPGRVDGHNAEYKSGGWIPKELRYELSKVFKEHITKGANKEKVVGQETIEKRKEVILGFFADLYRLKLKLRKLKNLSQKHLVAVFRHLEEQGQSPATIQNKISIMRTFCGWIGKNGMVLDASAYVQEPISIRRTTVVQEDKSWEGNGLDVLAKIADVEKEDELAAGALMLCYGFGLRIREAVLMNVFKAEDGDSLKVVYGTKGGRARSVPIEHEWQRVLFEKAKSMADQKTGRFLRRGGHAEASIRRIYYMMEKRELTLAGMGVSAHGLRHQYVHERFYELLGIQAPVKGGNLSEVGQAEMDEATGKLMERLGHSRLTIGAAYYGSRDRNPAKPVEGNEGTTS